MSKPNEVAVPVPRPRPTVGRLKAERVQELLRSLPRWRMARDGAAIFRTFHFPEPGAPVAFANLVSALAHGAGQSPLVTIAGEEVVCKLTTPAAGGVTLRDIALAKRILFKG